jgi:maltokinase
VAVLHDADLAAQVAPLLGDFLPRQRWFGNDIVSGAPTIAFLEVQRKDPLLAWLVVEVQVSEGRTASYQIVIGGRPVGSGHSFLQGKERVTLGQVDGLVIYDALVDPELALDVLAAVAPTESVDVARPLLVEQSNTSVVYDERLILKFFRRLHPEPNPDVEINRALNERGFPHAVPQRAELGRDGVDLAVVRDYLLGASDAWHLAQTSLRDLLNSRLPPGEAGGDFGPEAATLGEVVGALHVELAEVYGTTPGRPDDWLELMTVLLARNRDGVPEADRVERALHQLVEVDDPGSAMRIHGDLHLGQLLRADSGWYVLDFEGEPARPVSERIRPASPLRDVAGMIRSFHYAAEVALADRGRDTGPELRELAAEWEARASEAFWRGYLSVPGAVALLPADDRARQSLLAAFELDKAVYEIGYELDHRPSWAEIPIGAVHRILGRFPGVGSTTGDPGGMGSPGAPGR